MNLVDFIYTSKLTLGELLALFLQGNDDKVYITLYDGSDEDIIYDDIRIIDGKLNKYLYRYVIGLEMGLRLGIYLKK